MKFLAGLFFATMTSFLIALGATSQAIAPMPTVPQSVIVSSKRVAPTTTTTVASLVVDADAKCGQWWSVAVAAGWDEKDLRDLDGVLWRESRCDPTQTNSDDPNIVDGVKGSVGLAQVNVFWVQATKWYPLGYLQTVTIVSGAHDLYDPFLNLRAAKAIFDYDRGEGRCGWSAWAWKGCD
jgi:hypothetical protein